MDKIRTLIIDDEPLARKRLAGLLKEHSEFSIIGECSNGLDAVAAIQSHTPDVVFLDMQMPDLDGLGVLQQLGTENLPVIIFVTAYDTYAVKAFEVHAVDYLLKPFDDERFEQTIAYVKLHLRRKVADDLGSRLTALYHDLASQRQPATSPTERIPIKSAGRVFFLNTSDIDWLEAEGNYVSLHAGKASHLVRDTMSVMEAKLDSKKFLRIHRSVIVNTLRIKEMQPWSHGEYVLILQDGTRLTSSRNYADNLNKLLQKSH